MAIKTEELKKIVDELSEVTDPLAVSYPDNPDDFVQVLVGIYRKNKFTLVAINHVADDPLFGGSALDLLRSMIEDVIMVEYMIVRGKVEMAQKFKRYLPVQFHKTVGFFKELNAEVKQADFEVDFAKMDKDYQAVKEEFTHKPSGEDRWSWVGKTVEDLMAELHEEGALKDFDISRLTMAYTFGSWKNHLNPYDIVTSYLDSERMKLNSENAAKQALFLGAVCLIRLTTRYIDELRFTAGKDVFEEVAAPVKKISEQLAKLS